MAERWGNGWGWVGMRGPSLGRFLRGLRAEVNYIEGKRRKKRERGEKEKERKQCVRPGLLPPSPLPSWLITLPLWASGYPQVKQGELDRWVSKVSSTP